MKYFSRFRLSLTLFGLFGFALLGLSQSVANAKISTTLGTDPSYQGYSDGSPQFLTGPQTGDPIDIALNYLHLQQTNLGLTANDLADYDLSHYYTKVSAFTQVELDQKLNGIPVYNGMILVNVADNGSIINMHNDFVSDLASKVNATRPATTAQSAVESAAKHLGLTMTNGLRVSKEIGGQTSAVEFGNAGISTAPIPASLIYSPTDEGVRLAWAVEIKPKDSYDWWLLHVDAVTGEVIYKFNYTIHEDFIAQAEAAHGEGYVENLRQQNQAAYQQQLPLQDKALNLVFADTYKVYPWPVESPNHVSPLPPTDSRTVVTNPSADASTNGSPFGWHNDGTTSFTTTQGNNVDAQKGGTESDCGATLDCNHALNLSVAPTTGSNVDAAIDNLFYWNNVIHDVWYNYGFDEVSGNFQENNNGMGGAGGDSVIANAQAPGNCNANMATPTDGGNPTMNMFLCNITSPSRDGDLDNAVIVHEYTHGISIRQTGGPGNSSCLNNSEQMGEGWSDWYGLVMTIESGDAGTDSRGMGTYLFGEPATGPGIRPFPYTTQLTVNPHKYSDLSSVAIPHGVGSIWAEMLWEMTWGLIDNGVSHSGFDPDIYNGTGGNNLAMRLVNDGLKLQPCSPGFVDGRDAILLADQNLTGGANQCVIWKAFAKRGLGFGANQGSSNDNTDGTANTDIPPACNFLDPAPATQNVCAGTDAIYNINVNVGFTSPPVNMSVVGNPAGSIATFSPTSVSGPLPGSTSLTISSLGAGQVGNHILTVSGDDGVNNESSNLNLNVFPITLGTPTLITPSDSAIEVSNSPTLSWSAVSGAIDYTVEIDDDSAFGSIDYTATEDSTSHLVTASLNATTTYYWRVRANNICTTGANATAFSFTTANISCTTFNSTDIPKLIPATGTSGSTTSTLNVSGSGTILDVNITLEGTHTWMGDLDFNLASPSNTSVLFMDTGSCGSLDNFDVTLDDEGASALPCPPTGGGTHIPTNALSAYDTEDANGTWIMTINDAAAQDTGSLASWSLEICSINGGGGDPTIELDPTNVASTQATNTTSVQSFDINNVGTADLSWSITEDESSLVQLDLGGTNNNNGVYAPVNLSLDDGISSNSIGDSGQFVWFNRFTPAPSDYPFQLEEIWVEFGTTLVSVGEAVELVVHTDTDGDGDPGTGATLVGSYNVTVQATGATWNIYTLPSPIILNGPGDVLIGVINRDGAEGTDDFPAAIDETATQGRSWVGTWNVGDVPSSPSYPADEQWGTIDSFGFPGNWMVRGLGNTIGGNVACDAVDDIAWASVTPISGTTAQSGTDSVDVTFDSTGLATGVYTGSLCITSNDATNPVVELPLSLTVTSTAGPPVIDVSPASVTSTQTTDTTTQQTLSIGNTGGSDLIWTITEDNGFGSSAGKATNTRFNSDGSLQFLTAPSNQAPAVIAQNYLAQQRGVLGLTTADLTNMVEDRYVTAQTGTSHVEFRQTLNGIEVHNGMILVNVAKDGRIINMHNNFVPDLAGKANAVAPTLSAQQAVYATADHLNLTITDGLVITKRVGGASQAVEFGNAGISHTPITANLLYQPTREGVRLAWVVDINPVSTFDHWSVRIDAITGEFLTKLNYTIHEDFEQQIIDAHGEAHLEALKQQDPQVSAVLSATEAESMANTYRVYAMPVESPNHASSAPPADARTLESNPSADASTNGSPFGWHDDNINTYTTTQGNNVDAQKNGTESNCGATLDCDHALNLNNDPTTGTNVDAAIDNLFYWNNIIHDVWYNYGFDEVSRNFQEDNNGQGGVGSDGVTANAQAPGNCNANMTTLADGSNPTMNMFTCNIASPARDGDFDNGVIVHEYTHGISNRLTGGASVSCLNNSEQMGEGWSDWYGLMMTIEADDAGDDPRGIGTWLLGEGPAGPGVRTYRYSTDLGENPHTYADIDGIAIPHGVGSVWSAMLWEVTWGLIANGSQNGIDTDFYNGNGGNNLAMQLVTDGLKLQPCSPGFVDGRDAILAADVALTGGANQCVIWEAFAKRGLGFSADQGSSGSTSDGTEADDLPPICLATLKITKTATPDPVTAGDILTYNLLVENDTVGTLTNVVVSDTIQANQTYVPASATCGGSETGGVVTFNLGTMSTGTSTTCSFQVTINAGIGSTTFITDDFEAGLVNWTTTGLWNLESDSDTCGAQQTPFPSATNAAYYGQSGICTYNTGATNSGELTMNSDVLLTGSPSLNFSYFMETENLSTYDQLHAEISTNSGSTWTQLTQLLDTAWSDETIDLTAYAGQSVRIRFRFNTVDNIANSHFGVLIDDVEIVDEASVSNTACVVANEGNNDCSSVTTLVTGGTPPPPICQAPDDIPWLSLTPSNGTTAPANSTNVTLTFDSTGLTPGIYNRTICIDSNDLITPEVQVPVELVVTGDVPVIEVAPSSIADTLTANVQSNHTFTISNTGLANLDWTITEDDNLGSNVVVNDAIADPPRQSVVAETQSRADFFADFAKDQMPAENLTALAATPCVAGMAGVYPCDNVDLLAFMPLANIGGGNGNDIWGWTGCSGNREFAIMGRTNGTAFVEITDPVNPVYLGNLPTHTSNSTWRDIKTYADHAFIVSEASTHGMQVFDLTQLCTASPNTAFSNTAHYSGFGSAHNIVINEDTGFAYGVGTNTCSGGLAMVDISTPTNPTNAGCFSSDGYTHDAQCIVYNGPDVTHVGKEICFNYNEDTLTIVDVTNKVAPVQLSRTGYAGSAYTHQGWVTEDHTYVVLDDELDEQSNGHNTRTRIWDVSDLDAPVLDGFYDGTTTAIDHNMYVKGNLLYQANYRAGLQILDISNIGTTSLTEVASFDIYPSSNSANFNGAWSNYPYFDSGVVVVSGIEQGLFILQPFPTPPTPATCTAPVDISWASLSASSGTTMPGMSTDVTVTFDSTGLVNGTYTGTLCIESNDPVTPLVEVPLTLTVAGCSAPNPPADVTIVEMPNGTDTQLSWLSTGDSSYSVWYAVDDPYFNPGDVGTTMVNVPDTAGTVSWTHVTSVGNSADNYYYVVFNSCGDAGGGGGGTGSYDRTAEFDFDIIPGTP